MTRVAVTGIVLAGGRGSRFGGPKLDARIDGEPLLALATRAVAEVVDEVLIAGPASAPIAIPSIAGLQAGALRLVTDERPFEGPLVAIAGALRQATGTLVIVVGGDMPRLVPSVLRAMLERLTADERVDAVTLEPPPNDQARHDQGESPPTATLPLAFRVAPTLAVMADAVGSGDRSIVRLLARLRSIEVPASDWLVLDPDGRTLLDVDRPSDIEGLRRNDFRYPLPMRLAGRYAHGCKSAPGRQPRQGRILMPMVQAFWNKLNANERIVGYGIIVAAISWLVGLVGGGGFGGGSIVAAIIVAVIYWLKYESKSPINWPLPVQTLVLIVTGIEAVLVLLALVGLLGLFAFFGGIYLIALLGSAVAAGLMVWGAWKEYQAMPKMTPPAPPTAPPAAPPAPPAAS